MMRLLSNNFLSMEAFYCQKNPCFSQQVTLNQLYQSKTECKKIRIHQRSVHFPPSKQDLLLQHPPRPLRLVRNMQCKFYQIIHYHYQYLSYKQKPKARADEKGHCGRARSVQNILEILFSKGILEMVVCVNREIPRN